MITLVWGAFKAFLSCVCFIALISAYINTIIFLSKCNLNFIKDIIFCFLISIFILKHILSMFWLHVYALCTCSILRGQKKMPGPLRIKLNNVISWHVGSGNQTPGSLKSNQCTLLTSKPSLQPTVCTFVWACVRAPVLHGSTCPRTHICVDSEAQTQVISLGNKCLYPTATWLASIWSFS